MGDPTLTTLITGASAGIGRALAHEFAKDGYNVVLVARRASALEELAADLSSRYAINARAIGADLADPSGPQRVFDELEAAGVAIDVVVNNAGVGARGAVAELPLDRQLQMIQLNVTALTALTRLFLPGMLQRRHGGVLNVASTAAFQPGPFMSVYYATKAYVLSFTEGVAEEVAGSGLKVTCVAPGPTASEFARTADMTRSRLFSTPAASVEDVARTAYQGWKAGRVLVVVGARNRVTSFIAQRLAPRAYVRRLTGQLNSNITDA